MKKFLADSSVPTETCSYETAGWARDYMLNGSAASNVALRVQHAVDGLERRVRVYGERLALSGNDDSARTVGDSFGRVFDGASSALLSSIFPEQTGPMRYAMTGSATGQDVYICIAEIPGASADRDMESSCALLVRVCPLDGTVSASAVRLGGVVFDLQFYTDEELVVLANRDGRVAVERYAFMDLELQPIPSISHAAGLLQGEEHAVLEAGVSVAVDTSFLGARGSCNGVLLACNSKRQTVSLVLGKRVWVHLYEEDEE